MKPIFFSTLLFLAVTLKAQTIYTSADTIAVTQDSVTFQAGEFRGLIQWQYSADGQTWENLSGKTTGELKIAGTATGYYRAEITNGTCFPVYSDTAFIGAAADTAEVQTPEVPTLPGDSGFDYTVTETATDNAVEQVQFGAEGDDRIVQYAGTVTKTQYAEGSEGDDWILQQGGANTTIQQVVAGDGNDTVYQFAGSGGTTQSITGGDGSQTYVQAGGDGADTMWGEAGCGTSTISQYGGAGDDIIAATGSTSDDTISIYGQAGDDTITYTCSAGTDTVTINGGTGDDILTICMISGSGILLQDSKGSLLYKNTSVATYGISTITVSNAESIIVKNIVGDVVYQR